MVRSARVVKLLPVLPIVVVLVALGLVGRAHRSPSSEAVLNDYAAHGDLVQEDDQLIWNIAKRFVTKSRFESKLSINGVSKPDALNIYVLRADPERAFPELGCNCAAYVKAHMIVCNAAFIEYFRHLLEDRDPHRGRLAWERSAVLDKSGNHVVVVNGRQYLMTQTVSLEEAVGPENLNSTVDFLYRRFSFALLEWIVGHEVGHVVLGHSTGPKYESAADQYAIDRIGNQEDAAYAWIALGSIIDTLYGQAVEHQYPGRDDSLEIDPRLLPPINLVNKAAQAHPPLLVRAIAMSKHLVDSGLVQDDTGFADAVRRRITLISHGPDPPELCGLRVLPKLDIAFAPLPGTTTKQEEIDFDIEQGNQYKELAAYAQAVMSYTQAIDLIHQVTPTENQLHKELVDAYMSRGELYARQGDWRHGLTDWEAAIQADPTDSYAYSNVGFGLYELGQPEAAIGRFRTAVDLDSHSNADAWAGLGIALDQQKRTDEAVKAYLRALQIQPAYASQEWLQYEVGWSTKQRCASARLVRIIPAAHTRGAQGGCR
jgi:tetratricopeptide (TPR) repeat protein